MNFETIICPICGCEKQKGIGHLNRAKKIGAPVYCSKKCAGIARRRNKSLEEKKQEKSDYDKAYRAKNLDTLKINRHEYFKRTYDPVKAAVERKKRMPKHVEYCRQPAYKAKKKVYDEIYNAKRNYGEFGECFRLILEIEKEYDQREVLQINNLHNKSQKRKRKWQTLLNQNSRLTT